MRRSLSEKGQERLELIWIEREVVGGMLVLVEED
jgi:hypothetical protein